MKRFVLALLLVALPMMAAEKWWDLYNRGVSGVNGRNYEAAASALEKAIAEIPTENTAIRAGDKIMTYVPHFWLGIAKFNLGDLDAALREWKTSEDQGAIQNTQYYAQMKDWVARAQAEKVRRAKSAASPAKQNADAAVSRAIGAQGDAVAAGGGRTESYRAAQRKLQEALTQVGAAGTDVAALQRAAATATQARELFASAAEEGKKLKLAAKATPPPVRVQPQAVAPAPARVQPQPVAPPPAPVVVQQTPPPAPVEEKKPEVVVAEQPAVESEALVTTRVALQEYRRRLASISGSGDLRAYVQKALRDASKLQQELDGKPTEATIRRIATRVAGADRELAERLTRADGNSQLASAFRAFAFGDFARSEQLLTSILGGGESAEAYLLRGCARYTRAVLDGDDALLARARSDFQAALRINRALRLDQSAFSPKLVEYFEQVKKAS